MPPKLTSKNLFDVVFEQLPADAFIDTGPASLKEELLLEAAGMLDSNDASSASNDRSGTRLTTSAGGVRGGGGGGSFSYRRHLLPSSFGTAARGAAGLWKAKVPAVRAASSTAATQADDADKGADILDADAVDEGSPSPTSPSSTLPPPAYPETTTAAPVETPSLFRRVDDVSLDGASADCYRARRAVVSSEEEDDRRASVEGMKADDTNPLGFDMQLDTEDDAVREATKHAGYLAELQAVAAEEDAISEERQRHLLALRHAGAASFSTSAHRAEAANRHGGRVLGGRERMTSGITGRDRMAGMSPIGGLGHGGASTGAHGIGFGREAGGQGFPDASSLLPPGTAEAVAGGALERHSHRGLPGEPSAISSKVATGVTHGGVLTAEEQLQLMPPGLDHVYSGTCVMYRQPKNFGFVSPDVGGPDVYFVVDSIALSFTRLALRAFYTRNGMPLPPPVAIAYRPPPPPPPPPPSSSPAGMGKGNEAGGGSAGATVELPDDKSALAAPHTGAEVEGQQGHALTASCRLSAAPELGNTVVGPEGFSPTATVGFTHAPPAELGVLGAAPGLLTVRGGVDTGDRVSLPPTTNEELAWAEAAAALLTPATAQLLQYQVDQRMGGGGGIRIGDRVSFVVTRNYIGRGGGGVSGGGRLLRAEFIRGTPESQLAMPLEQSWFSPLFRGAVGRKGNAPFFGASTTWPPASGEAGALTSAAPSSSLTTRAGNSAEIPASEASGVAITSATSSPLLTRYTGCVRTYDTEEQRGYILCDEADAKGSHAPDVIFYFHSLLWDLRRSGAPLRRQVKEGMRVAYSVCGTERNGKYIATLLTTPEGMPFSEENMTYVENVQPYYTMEGTAAAGPGRRRGRGDDGTPGEGGGHGVAGGPPGGGGGGEMRSDGAGGDRKRAKRVEDDALLLFGEEDYPFM